MVNAIKDLTQRIIEYPGDRSESDWLDTFEFLRSSLGSTLGTEAQLGCYCISDFPGHGCAGGGAGVRGGDALYGIDSDCWEGRLCWSGNRGSHGYASAFIFPFLHGSAVQPRGRLADLGSNAEVDHFLLYHFENGRVVGSGWQCGDGPGEWSCVSVPGTVYVRDLTVTPTADTIEAGAPLAVDIQIEGFSRVVTKSGARGPFRISLIHANRNRERTNLVPWTSRPPKPGSTHVQTLSDCSFPTPEPVRIRLDSFNIRGGWSPGRYHLSLRVQNSHNPTHWAWSCDISGPFKLTIV